MAHPILMPKPGQMTEECTIIAWHKAEGDTVAKGDVLFEIETDKSAMEVESWETGILLKRVVAEGETVPVNAVCGWVGQAGEAIPDSPAPAPAAAVTPAAARGSCQRPRQLLRPLRPLQRLPLPRQPHLPPQRRPPRQQPRPRRASA